MDIRPVWYQLAAAVAVAAVVIAAPARAETFWMTNYGPVTLPSAPQGQVETRWGPWRGVVTGQFVETSQGVALEAIHVGSFHDIPCENTRDGAWYWGELRWVFDPGYSQFTGTFNRCGEGEENTVTGERTTR